jgi:hypothetical protein
LTDQITFKCKKCAAPRAIDKNNPPGDDDDLLCRGCGTSFGRFGDVKAQMMEIAKHEVEAMTKQALGLKPKWK